jgi:hypothetical protein
METGVLPVQGRMRCTCDRIYVAQVSLQRPCSAMVLIALRSRRKKHCGLPLLSYIVTLAITAEAPSGDS